MAAAVDDLTLRLTRRFDASPERLFDAWTDQEQFAEWFGPKGVTTVYCDLDPRTGVAWRLLGSVICADPFSGIVSVLRSRSRKSCHAVNGAFDR